MTGPHNPIEIFDQRVLRRHRARAARMGGTAEFLFGESGERLADRLRDVNRRFERALDLGCRDGALTQHLRALGIGHVIAADAAEAFCPGIVTDAEALPFARGSFDLIVSNLALHWTNDLPGALLQLRQMLKPDGLLVAAMWGGATLDELRMAWLEAESDIESGASPRVSPFADPRDLAGLLQRAGFALPVVDSDRLEVTYPDMLKLMQDLRAMGETNATVQRRKNFTRRATMLRAAEIYQQRHAGADGRIPASFEMITLTAWAPHESQQKPLRPGSAETRLADTLGTREHKAGDKATP